MEKNVLIRKAIINTLAASGGNVKDDAAVAADNYPGSCIICEDNSVSPPVELLPPIWKDKVIAATFLSSQAEVVQRAVIGRLQETVVADRRYKIEIGNSQDKYETAKKNIGRYAYTAPSTLTGVANTDRSNMYTALAAKINNDPGNNCTAYLVHKVAFTVGSTALPQIGETFTQATSSATFVLVAIDGTSGDITSGDLAGTMYLRSVSGTWDATSKVSTGGTSGAKVTTAAALTENQQLEIVDDANYYAARPYQRRGKNTVLLTQGFETATVEIGIATLTVSTTGGQLIGKSAVYSRGIGSRMLQDVPSYDPSKINISAGEHEFQLNALPVSTKTYRTWEIIISTNPAKDVLTAYTSGDFQIFKLYTDESNSTNTTNFKSALDSALGVTSTGA